MGQDYLLLFDSGALDHPSFDQLLRNSFADANTTNAPEFSTVSQNLFVLFPNAWGFMVSIWLNMAAVKLQYSDRMATSLRSSFVQLLDDNRKSFRGLDRREDIKDDAVISKDDNAPVQTFANLRKMALEIATQKTEAPAPHEKVVIGCKLWLIPNIINARIHSHTFHFHLGLASCNSCCFLVGGGVFAIIPKNQP